MKYKTKSAQYYDYFEDAKIIEIDDDNKKLAIVLKGNEEIIDIFDAGPYVDYNPYENYIKDIKLQKEKESKDKKYGVLYIQEETNYLDVNSNNNSNINNSKKSLIGKNLFIDNNHQNEQIKSDNSNLPINFSKLDEKSKDKNIMNGLKEIKRYTSLSKTKFQIYFLSQHEIYKDIKINIKKPKIKHKILSVINLNNDIVLGIKWFSFNRSDNINDKNLSENDKYLKKSKLLLVIGQEGSVSVYHLKEYIPFNITRVNLDLKKTQPFTNFKEIYNLNVCINLYNPIIDFNLLDKPYYNNDLTEISLMTLHINNNFTSWKIVYKYGQVQLRVDHSFQLPNFICENFLIDNNENFLICFNKKGIMIFLAKSQSFPFPLIYKYTYNEKLPPLRELQKLVYSNEVMQDNNDEMNNDNKKEKDKNKKKDKNNEYKDNEEDCPNFINNNENIFLEDDKFLKFLQKPVLLDFGTKFLFVKLEIKSNDYTYSLYSFDISELNKIEKDKNFLFACLNEYDDILITKIYSSKEKIYFSESPFAYFHPKKLDTLDDNLLLTTSKRKILKEMKFDFNIIVNNLYESLFIREGDNIVIIKLPVKDKPDLDIINNDIKLSKYIFYEQPTSENLKSNCLAKWTINNTLIVHSVKSLFTIIKFRKEAVVLGIPISKTKVIEYLNLLETK